MPEPKNEDGPVTDEKAEPQGIELTMTDSDNTFEPEEADKAVDPEPTDEGAGRS